MTVRLGVEEGLGVRRGQAGDNEGLDKVPLLGAGGAEELAKRARSAAARASTIASEGTRDIQALADVVAGHGHGAWHAEAAGKAVGDKVALVAAGGVSKQLAGAAMGAKAPRKAAENSGGGVRLSAAGGNLPALVKGTRVTSPVHLVEAKDAVDTTSLDLSDSDVESHDCSR